MSASREKQLRQEQADQVDSAVVQEEENRKSQKRSSVLYGVIAVVFVIVLALVLVWRSNVITKLAPAATIDGEKYNAAEVTFYYQNAYQGFLNNNYYLVSYIGLDPYSPLESQTINETAAAWIGAEEGKSWKDYFMDQALFQMAAVQNGLKAAEAEGFAFPASVQAQHDEAMTYLESTAASAGMSADQYLKNAMGPAMTEKVYSEQMTEILKFDAYTAAYSNGLTYSDSEIQAAYKDATQYYDEVAYEYVYISGAAETTDADGNTVEPTEEDSERAMTLARATADSILAAYEAGETLENAAKVSEDAMYNTLNGATYSGDAVTEWLFDDARTAGDAAVLENGTSVYVAVFQSRSRNEDPTIDVRHILIQPAAGTLTSEDEGYEDEQAQLKADAVAAAEDLLAQWKAGEATEESFGQLAMEHSTDTGSTYQGGLYTAVRPGEMVTEFNDWCFDSSRKTGDTDVVETSYGAHIMYFVGENLPYWKTLVVSDLQSADYSEWVSAFSADSTITEGFGMKFIG